MALLALVPNLGAFVVWGPAATLLALSGDWTRALILAVWGALAVGLIDNLLYPFLVGKRMRLNTLLVFYAILGGVFLLGASGIVLGPVIVVVTIALVDVWRRRVRGGQPAEAGIDAASRPELVKR
jgi:predicted PurR-regulated permease PerM